MRVSVTVSELFVVGVKQLVVHGIGVAGVIRDILGLLVHHLTRNHTNVHPPRTTHQTRDHHDEIACTSWMIRPIRYDKNAR